jgi:predicted permease
MIWLHSLPVAFRLLRTETMLTPVLVLAGLTSALLVSLGVIAYSQRQSRSYLLVVLALGTLIAKTCLGSLAIVQVLSMDLHHLFEHLLDVVMALCLLVAIYYARTTPSGMTALDD